MPEFCNAARTWKWKDTWQRKVRKEVIRLVILAGGGRTGWRRRYGTNSTTS